MSYYTSKLNSIRVFFQPPLRLDRCLILMIDRNDRRIESRDTTFNRQYDSNFVMFYPFSIPVWFIPILSLALFQAINHRDHVYGKIIPSQVRSQQGDRD